MVHLSRTELVPQMCPVFNGPGFRCPVISKIDHLIIGIVRYSDPHCSFTRLEHFIINKIVLCPYWYFRTGQKFENLTI